MRIALGQCGAIAVATGWSGASGLAALLTEQRFDLLIIDPTDRRLNGRVRTLSILLDRYPCMPVILYTALTLSGVKSSAPLLARYGTREPLVAGHEDLPTDIRAMVARLTADALADRFLTAIAPSLARLSPRAERAIRALFATPALFRGVEDIAAAAGITRRHLSRDIARAGLAAARHFLIVARVLRAYRLLKWERRSLAVTATCLRVAPRILARHIRLITGVTPTLAVMSMDEDELIVCCARVLQRATPEPPDTERTTHV